MQFIRVVRKLQFLNNFHKKAFFQGFSPKNAGLVREPTGFSNKSIILLGPKHSGKTSAGNALAALLSADFIDLDDCIAQRIGKSPRALYIEGPEIFRKAETEALAAILESEAVSPLVIAGGGGLIDNPSALSLLQKNTAVISVFLDVCVKTAWERIKAAGELPPFLRTENPQETHRTLHERRAAEYRQIASLVIEADNKTPEEIAGEIRERFS